MSLKGKLTFVGQTDTGRVREHNEDTIATDPDVGLLVLADGMGGYNAGEVASGIAVKTITNLVREGLAREDLDAVDRNTGLSRPSIVLRDAITRFESGDAGEQGRAVEAARRLGLGRFGEPSVRLVLKGNPEKSFAQAGWALLQETRRTRFGLVGTP